MKIAVQPEKVRRVGLVGAGVIGSGWASYFLARGLDVAAYDPHPEAEKRMRAAVTNAWPALKKIGLAKGASKDRLTFSKTMEGALSKADFIQESAPENEKLKRKIMIAIGEAARPDVIIASSTSGLLPTRLQEPCKNPARVLIGHPFNPVYILPLVEVVGGDKTHIKAIDWAMKFYGHWGKWPLHCRKEIPGHLSDRLQEALWREVLHIVAEGSATTGELDAAISGGPGLRWALMGTCLTFHLAGGDAGMRHMLEQFGPALQLPWTKLKAPKLTDELIDRMVDGTQAQAGDRSVKELERMRDDFLIGVLKLRSEIEKKYGFNQRHV